MEALSQTNHDALKQPKPEVLLSGESLTLEGLIRIARNQAKTTLQLNPSLAQRIENSVSFVRDAVDQKTPIYGVNTGFGGMSDVRIQKDLVNDLQTNLLYFLKSGVGENLSIPDRRAAMALRANSLLKGVSACRLELIKRIIDFLNFDIVPHMKELGSIGASGDLVPLASIGGALLGLPGFKVTYQGKQCESADVLAHLKLPRIQLEPKEGLALVNGTSAMTGIAARVLIETAETITQGIVCQALFFQGLDADLDPLQDFIHQQKPHPGQRKAAKLMRQLLEGSLLVQSENKRARTLVQDRYSVRCLPQYLGPILDGLKTIKQQVETEMNSATDNPIFDANENRAHHGGNFLGQYISVGMDQLRAHMSLFAKHLDTQIALLCAPEFNNGLSPSLVGNPSNPINMGLKGLQIAGNSIVPIINFLGQPIADRYLTHSEQFNQNISSQGYASATLASQALELLKKYTSICFLFGIQAVELRAKLIGNTFDARPFLSPATVPYYEFVKEQLNSPISAQKPIFHNDQEQDLEGNIQYLDQALQSEESKSTYRSLLGELL